MCKWQLSEHFDLLLCCEVLQRLNQKEQTAYFSQINTYAKKAVIFAPNSANSQHAGLSGLKTVSLSCIQDLTKTIGGKLIKSGWLDVPPFPPGLTRSDSKRGDALSSPFQKFLFWGVNRWADAEGLIPQGIRKNHAHIAYAAFNTGAPNAAE